jgi:hypothetical protein
MDSEAATESAGGIFGCLFIIAYSIVVLIGGYIGISDHYGSIAAFLSILALFPFRIPIPLMIGTVFFLVDEFDWNGFLAFFVVFLPGIPLMLTGTLLSLFRNKE